LKNKIDISISQFHAEFDVPHKELTQGIICFAIVTLVRCSLLFKCVSFTYLLLPISLRLPPFSIYNFLLVTTTTAAA